MMQIVDDWSFMLLGLMQVANVICYAFFTTYDAESDASSSETTNTINHYYPFYQDVHVMILIGFGFLMTFMHKYFFSSVGYNFLLTAITIQQSILINGFFHCLFSGHWTKINMNIESLITGDFAAGAVLISFGAVLGKASLSQLILMVPLELVFYSVNESLGVFEMLAVDMGGSMYVHTFGAYFGLAVSYMISNKDKIKNVKDNFGSSRNSDMFAMIGTLFLWIFWPSFNGALAIGNSQHRVVINTVLSLTNSCLSAFVASKLLHGKFSMVDIQNATLAGGVAIGSSADLVIGPYAALIIGSISGVISVYGYKYISPFLERRFGLHDTCGVHNLHGIPGLIGGTTGAISASLASDTVYGDNITQIFSAREYRSAFEQGGYQFSALLISVAMAICGGAITGKICNIFQDTKSYGDDSNEWCEEESEEQENQEKTEEHNEDTEETQMNSDFKAL
tara:strand:+ start:266 stop:1621 length:1356 start_codon:yes stop_codon:yes gene_type:complete